MMNAALRALILAAGLFLTACGKKEDEKSRSSLLSSGKWRLTEKTTRSSTNFGGSVTVTELDLYGDMDACERDNISQFQPSGKYVLDEGASKCSPQDPQTNEEGSWQLLAGDTKIKVTNTASGDYSILTIVELTESRLRVTGDTTFALGNGRTARVELSAAYVNP